MPQQTNLNVAPYFDDYDPSNDFYRVLFKPGYPVQARELTALQSILQNQIEKFGQHFFKEGAKVIPGNTGYNRIYYGVQINNNYQGVPVSAYVDQLIGTKITGQRSGVTAVVDKVLLAEDSERGQLTLYVNYLTSNTGDNSTQVFSDGESLTCSEIITSGLLGNTAIAAGAPFALTVASDAAVTGSSFQIQNGVYFVRGQFCNVNQETLILDQYNNAPSYRVGLFVNEEIINADIDESLNDNSQGFNNYSAPGADRLKISLSLYKKSTDDFNDNSFVELAVINDGVLRTARKGSSGGAALGGFSGVYSANFDLTDTLARRTYDESGNYDVKPFDVTLLESLDDNIGNRGVFKAGQFTPGGETPSDDLALYKISPGKAYVKGYEIETVNPTFLDVPKPREVNTLKDQSIIYNTGPTFKINSVFRTPTVGIGSTYVLSLRDERVGVNSEGAPGQEIGLARVYDFRLESGSYEVSESDRSKNQWDISLYDVQTFSELTLNQPITQSVPAFIEGKNSGATAFLVGSVTSGVGLTVYEKNGNFIADEQLIINGINNGRTAIGITDYTVSDVKSLYGTDDNTIGINTFSANIIPTPLLNVGVATVGVDKGAAGTVVQSTNPNFPGITTIGNLIQYSDLTISEDPILARVISVSSNSVSVVGVATVSGVCNGGLPVVSSAAGITSTAQYKNVSDLKVLSTKFDVSTDNTLVTRLSKSNISNVDLTGASVVIRKTFNVNISSGRFETPIPTVDTNESFQPFTPKRYSLIGADGKTHELTEDQFDFGSGNTCQIRGLTDPPAANKGATLIATLKKQKPKAKEKIRNRVKSIVVNYSKDAASGIGTTTLNDGLTYGSYPYGTRVQDKNISINDADIIEVLSIYESADTSDPSSPKVNLSSIVTQSTTTNELIIGEQIIGQSSDAVAMVAEKPSDSQITVIYQNEHLFTEGEIVNFQESGSSAVVSSLDSPSFDISPNFSFVDGQQSTIYNIGQIKRKSDSDSPSKKIKIYYSNGSFDANDNGDFITANSYNQYDYGIDIPKLDNISNTDMIDIRPRASVVSSVSEGDRSPLEFKGRNFNASGNSAPNILASDESLLIDYSFYLARIDRIFLSKEGQFQIKYGDPGEDPQKPVPVDGAIEIATVRLPPYLYNVAGAQIDFLDRKRFTMSDIKNLENRIKNLEYYTTLSLLETNTANLFVADSDGLNRFKSGFFVDNFTGFKTQEQGTPVKNSIDPKNKELRPRHYTNSVDLIFGPVVGNDPTDDLNFSTIEGINVRKKNDIITLDYSEVEWLKQSFATRSESVTPFLISFWQGTMELTPSSDTWVDTARLQPKIINVEGDYQSVFNRMVENGEIDRQTGFGPVVWGSWQTTWTGTTTNDTTRDTTISDDRVFGMGGWINNFSGGFGNPARRIRETTNRVTRETTRTTTQQGVENRTGTQTLVTESFDRTSVGDRVVSRDLVPFMRSRNVEFIAKRVKPLTKLYAFFDGQDVTKYCVPKILQISMTSGTFQVGETVIGMVNPTGLSQITADSLPSITFRVAQSNHKEGPYNVPTKVFAENPYTNQSFPASYSSTSNVLNVDTFSLSNEPQGSYFGWVQEGMVLRGQSSGAIATIDEVQLLSDIGSFCGGSLYIPNPNNISFPRFEAGTKVLSLTNDPDNNPDNATTVTDETFTSSGTLETVQENIVSVRNARLEQRQQFQERNVNRSLGTEVVGSSVVAESTNQQIIGWYDPLAQSFLVEDPGGIFVTKCDVFFRTKDDMDIPVVFQIRSMQNGLPTQHVLPFSEVVLDPSEVNISADGSVATTVEFKAPIYLEGNNTEYAVALASNSTKYSVYISRIGENDLLTDTFISNQPYLGSLFKSQNASTWEPSQWEDLKFTMYRAEFETSGTVEFYSPELTEGNDQIPTLQPDSIILSSRKIRVGLDQTVGDSYEMGNTIIQDGTMAEGNIVGAGGSIIPTGLSITNAGIGYTPLDGNQTFGSVNLVTITGTGKGAVANVYVNNGVAAAATITNGGTGYSVGDVLGITTIGISTGGSGTVGRNARFSITGIGMTNELTIDNIQGEFVVGTANTLFYTNSSGIKTELGYVNGGDVQIDSIDVESDGLHVQVNHKNHGMYSTQNRVKISDVQSDVKPTKLSIALETGNDASFTVDDATSFSNFENVGVGTTNRGYVKIGKEIVEYNNVVGNVISISSRGDDKVDYSVGTPVYKYELGGVSLKRINTTHGLSTTTATATSGAITFDSYNIKLDMTGIGTINDDRSNDVGFPKLYLNQTKSCGGYQIKATQNMPFEVITPIVQNVTTTGTTLGCEVRTTSTSSISGNETSYLDEGFESIAIGEPNYLDSPRAIYSKINEDEKLDQVEGNKSLQMRLTLGTTDPKVSPVIDGQRISTILTNNRVNSVVSDFTTDSRVKTVTDDPTACQYITKELQLESSATSIKIILSGHTNPHAKIRAFYAVGNDPGFEPIFTPFPGFDNLNSRGELIAKQKSDGLPDRASIPSNQYGFGNNATFKEFTFTADKLPTFRYYRIKLLLTSTSQVFVPKVKDLRVMALA
jgi:hypothetical protein